MDYRQEYEKWCNDPYFDEQTKAELKAIAGDDKRRWRIRFYIIEVERSYIVSKIWCSVAVHTVANFCINADSFRFGGSGYCD